MGYSNHSERFLIPAKFDQQYYPLYNQKLQEGRTATFIECCQKWGEDIVINQQLAEIQQDMECCVYGIVVVAYKKRPSVIKKFVGTTGRLNSENIQKDDSNYYGEDDEVFIEDESGRLSLVFAREDMRELVINGIVLGLKGCLLNQSTFEAYDICFPSANPPPPISNEMGDACIVFIAGLEVGRRDDDLLQQVLAQFLSGCLGAFSNQLSGTISRVVLLGNNVYQDLNAVQTAYGAGRQEIFTDAVSKLDEAVDNMACSGVRIDILPGAMDPGQCSFPQRPMSRLFFPCTSSRENISLQSNPYDFSLENLRILATSGQNIASIAQFSPDQSPLTIMKNCVMWRQLAPTASDLLESLPSSEVDPFLIKDMPNLLIAGNTDQFVEGWEGDTKIVGVPSFGETHSVVVVNQRDLSCRRINFDSIIN